MTFPVELERIDKGLVFKLRESKPIIIEAEPLGKQFDMTYEDRPHGAGDRFGGEPRYGNFGEQLDTEIEGKGLTSEVANAYLRIGDEREVSKKDTIYGNHPPIERPRIVKQKLQLYSLDEKAAKGQRAFTAAFIMAWSP